MAVRALRLPGSSNSGPDLERQVHPPPGEVRRKCHKNSPSD